MSNYDLQNHDILSYVMEMGTYLSYLLIILDAIIAFYTYTEHCCLKY